MRQDRVILLLNTFTKGFSCNWWNSFVFTKLKESITCDSLGFSEWYNEYTTLFLACRQTFVLDSRINKEVYWCSFEDANTIKHVPECSCSLLRVLMRILAHLAHLAQFFSDFKSEKWIDVLILFWACKYKKACQWA